MANRKVIDSKIANTASKLGIILGVMLKACKEPDNLLVKSDEVNTVNADGDAIMVRLIEETLTDGSKVFDVVFE